MLGPTDGPSDTRWRPFAGTFPRRRRIVRNLLYLLLIDVSLVVGAASVSAQAPEAETSSTYQRAVRQAVEEFGARRFEEARVLFRRAHEESPNARTARGIGMASFELSDYVEAYLSLSAALVDTRQPLTSEMRAQTEALRDQASTFVSRLVLDIEPSGATVLIDGSPPTIADGAVLVNPGQHSLTVRAPRYLERVESIRVDAGSTTRISIRLASSQPAAQAPAQAPRTQIIVVRPGLFSSQRTPVIVPRVQAPAPLEQDVDIPASFRSRFEAEAPDEVPARASYTYTGGRFALSRVGSVGVERAFADSRFGPVEDLEDRGNIDACDWTGPCSDAAARLGVGLELRVRVAHRAELALDVETGIQIAQVTAQLRVSGDRADDESRVGWWLRVAPVLRIASSRSSLVVGLGGRVGAVFTWYEFDFSTASGRENVDYVHRRRTIEGLFELGGRVGRRRDDLVLLRAAGGPAAIVVDLAVILPFARGGR